MIFSGGSAANSLVDVFDEVRQKKACSLSYVIPISDNGGSSSELISKCLVYILAITTKY